MTKDPTRRPKKKKRQHQKKSGAPVSVSQLVADLRRQLDSRWPNLSQRLGSVIRVSREKLDNIYCSAAQFVIEHKEAFDDRRAERKADDRTVDPTTPQPETPLNPVRTNRQPVNKRIVTGALCSSSVKKRKMPPQNILPET